MGNKADKSIAGYQNPKCFAKALCECSGGVDDEHYVPANALSEITQGKSKIFVRNLGFQKRGVYEEMGIANLTSRVLCMYHNNRLSSYDVEFGKLIGAHDAMFESMGVADGPAEHLFINGDLVERWILKTLCGGLYSGNFLVPPEDKLRGVELPREWIDILYKGFEMPAGRGLFLLNPAPGEAIENDEAQLSIGTITGAHSQICGLLVVMYAFRFVFLMTDPPDELRQAIAAALYRPEGILIRGCNKQLIFQWKAGYQSGPLVMTFQGRRWVHKD